MPKLPKKGHNRAGGVAADLLKSVIERVERLEEEKAGIAADIREVFAEAKGNGLDVKTIRAIIKLRKLDSQEREEQEALLDIYKAALGMLGDTPLGEAAIKRLTHKPDEPADNSNLESQDRESKELPEEYIEPAAPSPTIEEARKMAQEAAASGKPVTDNPFPARDSRRAAWDEEWCKASGSDGMEVPEAWRRAPKKKEDPSQQEPKEN